MTKIENNDDFSMRNSIFIADLHKNAILTIFRFSKKTIRSFFPQSVEVWPVPVFGARAHRRGEAPRRQSAGPQGCPAPPPPGRGRGGVGEGGREGSANRFFIAK